MPVAQGAGPGLGQQQSWGTHCSQQPGLVRGPQTCTALQQTDGKESIDFLGYSVTG